MSNAATRALCSVLLHASEALSSVLVTWYPSRVGGILFGCSLSDRIAPNPQDIRGVMDPHGVLRIK